jgi:hypothetical protein
MVNELAVLDDETAMSTSTQTCCETASPVEASGPLTPRQLEPEVHGDSLVAQKATPARSPPTQYPRHPLIGRLTVPIAA